MWCSPRRRNFNPRTPRGVRRPEPQRLKPMSDFNPRTPRGVRPPTKGIMLGGFFISIHAPREGCDSRCPQPELPKTQFQSTHPARGATRISTHCCVTCTFQSTHPARGATRCSRGCLDTRSNFNPRTPRGVRPLFVSAFDQYDYDFNPRTPRGVRRHHQVPSIAGTRFQSTHPARGATWPTDDIDEAARISIHAPREGCDMARSGLRRLTWISIHAPREGCDACPVTWSAAQRRISIHAPREGCDGRRPDRRPSSPDFNPRTPRGVRLGQGPQGGLLH